MLNSLLLNISREYRPELNGLRALAVILVLFYHLNFDWMRGGYLGVDVFLVISGYFISRNILYDLQQGSFTFYRFYTKRLRRLFPALLFTLAVVLIIGYFLFNPFYLERLGKSTFFSSVSLSNFFFWSEAGYFDLDSGSKPLLHMWSLSLEEQFYLFWPLLLFFLFKYLRKHILLVILLLILGSIVLGEWYYASDPSAVFYLIPFRMFEFLLGASCIWLERFFTKRPKILLEGLFLIGLLLIIFSGIQFDHSSKMPGLLSLVPCMGAVFIIYGGKAPIMSWALKNKIVELIGKSSYSIYLIHWPIVVYYKYWRLTDISFGSQIKIGVISILLGLLMWYFIENTFRYARDKKKKPDRIWIAVPALILMICLFSGAVWNTNGAPSRFDSKFYLTKEEMQENMDNYFENYRSNDEWLNGDPSKGHVLIMGNSHSIDLIYALRQNGYEGKITSLQSLGKCYNFGESFIENARDLCKTKKEQNLKNENWKKADAIYLHDNWHEYDPKGFKRIIKSVRNISQAPVFVFGPKMTYQRLIPDIIWASQSKTYKAINNHAKRFDLKDHKTEINEYILKEFTDPFYNKNNIFYIDVLRLQGGENLKEFEVVSKDSLKFLYFDGSHFTEQGSKEFGGKMKKKHPYLFDLNILTEKYPLD